MKLFKCRLIFNNKVKECFFREGKNAQDVLNGLKIFHWGAGNWEIEVVI